MSVFGNRQARATAVIKTESIWGGGESTEIWEGGNCPLCPMLAAFLLKYDFEFFRDCLSGAELVPEWSSRKVCQTKKTLWVKSYPKFSYSEAKRVDKFIFILILVHNSCYVWQYESIILVNLRGDIHYNCCPIYYDIKYEYMYYFIFTCQFIRMTDAKSRQTVALVLSVDFLI